MLSIAAQAAESETREAIEVFNLNTVFNGVAAGALVWPALLRRDTLRLGGNYKLIGLTLTSAAIVDTVGATDPTAGIFVVVGRDEPRLSVSVSMNSIASQIYPPAFTATPVARAVNISFRPLGGITIPTGTPISLYGVAGNDAANYINATAALLLIPSP